MCVYVCVFISWDVGEWSECSKTCGPGYQHRQVICRQTRGHRGNSTVIVAPSFCDVTEMPETTTVCQLKICSEWQIRSEWTEVCEWVGLGKWGKIDTKGIFGVLISIWDILE